MSKAKSQAELKAELDAARAEAEALRLNAARYVLIREQHNDVSSVLCVNYKGMLVCQYTGVPHRGLNLDASIDDLMAEFAMKVLKDV